MSYSVHTILSISCFNVGKATFGVKFSLRLRLSVAIVGILSKCSGFFREKSYDRSYVRA